MINQDLANYINLNLLSDAHKCRYCLRTYSDPLQVELHTPQCKLAQECLSDASPMKWRGGDKVLAYAKPAIVRAINIPDDGEPFIHISYSNDPQKLYKYCKKCKAWKLLGAFDSEIAALSADELRPDCRLHPVEEDSEEVALLRRQDAQRKENERQQSTADEALSDSEEEGEEERDPLADEVASAMTSCSMVSKASAKTKVINKMAGLAAVNLKALNAPKEVKQTIIEHYLIADAKFSCQFCKRGYRSKPSARDHEKRCEDNTAKSELVWNKNGKFKFRGKTCTILRMNDKKPTKFCSPHIRRGSDPTLLKNCEICHKWRSLKNYTKGNNSWDGLKPKCKDCEKK